MEGKANNDASPDASENEISVETSGENEGNDRNDDEGRKASGEGDENYENDAKEDMKVTVVEEGKVDEESKIVDKSGEIEGNEEEGRVEEEIKTTDKSAVKEGKEVLTTTPVLSDPSPTPVLSDPSPTPVLSDPSPTPVLSDPSPTPANDDRCPSPPPRQKRKSRTNKETRAQKETQEKAQGEGKEIECDTKTDTEIIKNDEGMEWKEKRDKEEEKTEKETTHTKLENDRKSDTIKNEKQKTGKETTPTEIENKARNRNRETDTPKDTAETKAKDTKDSEKNDEKDVDKDSSVVGLKQELNLWNCVGLIVGNIIGTGIFVSPRAVLQYTGSVGMSLIVWVVSGFMAIVGAFCYAELGTMIPQSGGNYTYLHEAYGSLPAFIYLWMTVTIGIPGSRAVAALTFANYVLQPFFPNQQSPPDSALRIVGILLITLLTFINSRRVRWATTVQDSMALTKVFALIMIIVVGMFHLIRGTTDNYENPMEGTSTNPALVVTAFYQTLYAYEGWDSLNGIMEELKDPFRNMPRAIAISVTCVIIIYTLTNVAYFAVLPQDLMLASPAVAVTFGNLALGVMAWTIPLFVACSVSGGLNGSTMTVSRLLHVSARRGHLPRLFSFVHVDNFTPVPSLFFAAFMSMWMFVTSDVRVLINYLAFAGNLLNLACISSFFYFRIKHPDLPRPVKVWIGFPIIYTILSFFLCVVPVVKNPLEVVAALLVLATGLPVYYFCVHRKEKPRRLVTAMDKVTYVCQLLFMAVPEEKSH